MKEKTATNGPEAAAQARPKRSPRVAAVRRIEPERPHRVWSLLLPPAFWSGRK